MYQDKHVDMLAVNMFLVSMNRSTNPFIRKVLSTFMLHLTCLKLYSQFSIFFNFLLGVGFWVGWKFKSKNQSAHVQREGGVLGDCIRGCGQSNPSV